MSLDRSHPVFTGNVVRDRTPPRYRYRSLDEEIGSRTFGWKYRRYICILGDQNVGRRSLAKRFFQDCGELRVDGNWWLRGRIPLSGRPFPRGELDLLIRIVPTPEEESHRGVGYRRALVAAGLYGNAALFIFAFVCAEVRSVYRVEHIYGLFYAFMRRNYIRPLVVGTKCDLRYRVPYPHRFMSEDDIRSGLVWIFAHQLSYREPPPYVECSVLDNVNVDTVIKEALHIIL